MPEEAIDALLHAAMSGPSACNRTPWEFWVVTQEEALQALRGASRFTNHEAKLAIVVSGNLSRALPQQLAEYWIQDCSAATENILLQATELGLGAVWCGIYPQKRPPYDVAFVLLEEPPLAVKMPPWAIRLVLDLPGLERAVREAVEADEIDLSELPEL